MSIKQIRKKTPNGLIYITPIKKLRKYNSFSYKNFLSLYVSSKKESLDVNTIEDFKGLKMRIPGLGGDIINAMGGTSVSLPGGEISAALQAGTIDATEWVGPYNDLAFYKRTSINVHKKSLVGFSSIGLKEKKFSNLLVL